MKFSVKPPFIVDVQLPRLITEDFSTKPPTSWLILADGKNVVDVSNMFDSYVYTDITQIEQWKPRKMENEDQWNTSSCKKSVIVLKFWLIPSQVYWMTNSGYTHIILSW